jgi:ubiquinol-cytochrome c reductase cytochrome c1 subunit
MTGYGYAPPFGIDVPEGKFFNPYFDHMIVGMPPQLFDGMIEYEDGTKSSVPQMAHDVSEYLAFIGRAQIPDLRVTIWMYTFMLAFFMPVALLYSRYHMINTYSHRFEVYAIKNGGYKKFREKMFKTFKIPENMHNVYS